jgi:hypothetical protein
VSPPRQAQRWSDLTDQQKKVIAVALVVHLIVLTLTWRDLARRPADAVRGPKRLWRLAATMNTSGSLSYWLFGRRRPPAAGLEPEGAPPPA